MSAEHNAISQTVRRQTGNRDVGRMAVVQVVGSGESLDSLQAGRSVVIDNTTPTVADRAPLIALGRAHGARISGYYFEPSVSSSLERNREREGRARVPDVAIYTTRKKLMPPSYAEGFDTLYVVRIAGHGAFEVRKWTDSDDAGAAMVAY